MYKCNKCDKSFKFKSHLERHINNKTPCNKVKEELSCIACNINFKCNAEQLRHEKSKKHINNYNVHIENLNANINITNNIYTFPEGTKPFSETNLHAIGLTDIDKLMIEDYKLMKILNSFKEDEENIYGSNEIFVIIFKYFIKLFAKLHFNLAYTENNNCAIFSFNKTHNDLIEYYVLEIDNNFHLYSSKKIQYNIFIEKFINLLKRINYEFESEDFNILLKYIIRYDKLLTDDYTKINIENDLLNEYNKFNDVKDEKALEDEELSRARILFLKKAFGHIEGKKVPLHLIKS